MTFDFSKDPLINFELCLAEARQKNVTEPTAMSLATVNSEGQPHCRIVYFKGMIRGGLSFYTNYNGAKAKDLAHNKLACVNFYWPEMHQQIRIQGPTSKLTREESELYFKTRPRMSQIGAWASQQSERVPDLKFLNAQFSEIEKKFEGKEIPCPEGWGGFHLIPQYFEFWFGKEGRLHERYAYQIKGSVWERFNLFP